MLEKVVTLACALFGLLSAVSVESWLRRHHGNKRIASEAYTYTLEKYGEFWLAQLIPLAIILIVVGALYGFGIKAGFSSVCAYAAGAFTCFIAVFLGSRSYASGAVSASSLISDGEIKSGMRSAFRGSAVMGIVIATAGLAVMCFLLFYFKQNKFINVAEGCALGAVICGIEIRLSGSVLTSAHKLTESDDSYTDYSGAFAAAGADFAETFLLAACACVLLAESGVNSSGVAATFTISAAAKYPLVVLGTGLAASIVGIFAFRAGTGKYSDFAFSLCTLLSVLLVFASSVYFSIEILGTPAYAYCIGFGLLAQLLSGEFCKLFSMDGAIFKGNIPKTKDDEVDVPMINGLSLGLIGSFVPVILTIAILTLSYSIAQHYGVALAAVGVCCVTAVNVSIRGYASIVSFSCSFAEHNDESLSDNLGYYNILRRSSSKAKAEGKAYSSIGSSFVLSSLLMVVSFKYGIEDTIDLTNPNVFSGMIFGTAVILLIMGLLIKSILGSANSMLDSAGDAVDEFRNVSSINGYIIPAIIAAVSPVIVGFLMGIECLMGFMGSAIITGMTLVFVFNNTGRYYDRISIDAITSILKVMTAVSIACTPSFIEFGGVLF